jgi:hypothetical protein
MARDFGKGFRPSGENGSMEPAVGRRTLRCALRAVLGRGKPSFSFPAQSPEHSAHRRSEAT